MTGVPRLTFLAAGIDVPGGPCIASPLRGETLRVTRVHWMLWEDDSNTARLLTVTAYGLVIGGRAPGRESDITLYPAAGDLLPAWMPRPPAWFYTALDTAADALQQPERGRPLAECARCGREIYPGDYLCCPDPPQPVND